MKPTILVVDDAVENLRVLSEFLSEDYNLKMVKSAAKGLEILSTSSLPDLILLDVLMPEKSGFEWCAELKKNDKLKHIPVIFLTSLNEEKDEITGFQLGGVDFVSKPFHPDVTKARIRTQIDLAEAKRKSKELLNVLLPEHVVEKLINEGRYQPEKKENVSIMFCDFIGFTEISNGMEPEDLINEVSSIFGVFDEICERNKVTRIKTIGDAYMAVSGLSGNDNYHADYINQCGTEMIHFLYARNKENRIKWNCRIGVHSGSVVAGIVGKNRFIYDVMGDDVNISARVEQKATPMSIATTRETLSRLESKDGFNSIGLTELKGKGQKEIFIKQIYE